MADIQERRLLGVRPCDLVTGAWFTVPCVMWLSLGVATASGSLSWAGFRSVSGSRAALVVAAICGIVGGVEFLIFGEPELFSVFTALLGVSVTLMAAHSLAHSGIHGLRGLMPLVLLVNAVILLLLTCSGDWYRKARCGLLMCVGACAVVSVIRFLLGAVR